MTTATATQTRKFALGRYATVVTRVDDAGFSTQQPWDTIAPRLRNFAEPSRFSF